MRANQLAGVKKLRVRTAESYAGSSENKILEVTNMLNIASLMPGF